MTESNDSSSSVSSETNANQADEYYEEADHQTLDLRKRKVPPSTSFVKAPPVAVDPVKKLNEQLNRQFRPDLAPPSSSPAPTSFEQNERVRSPGPLIFDARAKPVKSKNEPSVTNKNKLINRVQQLAEPSVKSTTPFETGMYNQQTSFDGYQVPPGMVLVAAPQQEQSYPRVIEASHQQQSYPRVIEASHQQPHAIVSQYQPSTVVHSNSFKTNRAVPPPSTHKIQPINNMLQNNSFQAPSSMLSTNQLLLQSSYMSQQQQQQQQQQQYHQQHQQQPVFKHIDQSKSSKKKQKKQSAEKQSSTKTANRSFALYNQQNGRIEGVVKNRLNVVSDDVEESKIIDDDDDDESQGECSTWLAQPLCLGLSRLTGGILFGSMVILGCGSIAGLIASIVLYSQDSSTDAQWKILGMVVCAIMLITIIVTLLIFIYCYKQGYMFDQDDDVDPTDPSTTHDAEGNERQKAVLRKIYKFNRPNETPPVSNIPQHALTPPPRHPPAFLVSDKQTNTETTIAVSRPNDIERGVWPSINAYGGIAYRPLIHPHMTSTFIQVFPHEIEQAMQPPQIVYQVVAPTAAVPPPQIQPQIQPKVIQIPAPQPPVVEVVETKSKRKSKAIRVSTPESSIIEYVEPRPKQPRVIQIPAPETPVVEYIEKKPKQQQRVIQMSDSETSVVEYVETTQRQARNKGRPSQAQKIIVQPSTHIEYVDIEEQQQPRGHRISQKPQYEIVEEVSDRSSSASPVQEIVEIVDASKHRRHRGRKKEKKQGFGRVSIKHLKSSH